jgi:HK97 family phage prohead protease
MDKIFIKAYIQKAGEKTYKFLASTNAVDRQGDSVDQSGWELKNFMNNPVFLWAHRYDELPLGKATMISVTANGLEAEMVFADEEGNPKAQQVKKLVDDGILNAVSVGFIPKERNGNIITRAELLEISIVPVPANQEALALAYKDMDLAVKKDIEDVLATEVEVKAEPIVEKSGRILSKENRKSLEIARDSLKASLSEIEKLLEKGVATTEDEEAGDETVDNVSESDIEKIKRSLRNGNTNVSEVLAILKRL